MAQTVPATADAPSSLIQNYGRQDVRFVRGEGCWLWDDQGRKHLDAFAGVAVSALGHAHPALVATITRQVATVAHTSNHYHIPEQEALARVLVATAFPGKALFCNSGAEANEAAYKLCRLWGNVVHGGRKTRMIAFQGGFHGRTIGALSLTANPAYREPFAPLPAAEFLPFGDVAALRAAFADDIAGVWIEPIQGEGGVHVAPAGFLAELRALCDKHQALLVVDEVQTGVGRTGRMWGYEHEGIVPDIIAVAKGLGGGLPIGGIVARDAIAGLFKPGLHGTTFGGNHLACAAALTVLAEVGRPGFIACVAARGRQLQAGLQRIFPNQEVRGRGLLLGVQLPDAPQKLVTAARAEGLIVGPSGGNTLRLAPPLTIAEGEVDELLARLERAKAKA
jgi:predicted acetylornithine/succinylornithine family transaminase